MTDQLRRDARLVASVTVTPLQDKAGQMVAAGNVMARWRYSSRVPFASISQFSLTASIAANT